MLKGAKNLATYHEICKPAKFVMSFHLLKLIGHEIAKSKWEKDQKLVIWAACCVNQGQVHEEQLGGRQQNIPVHIILPVDVFPAYHDVIVGFHADVMT
jgi:hypothetical protein